MKYNNKAQNIFSTFLTFVEKRSQDDHYHISCHCQPAAFECLHAIINLLNFLCQKIRFMQSKVRLFSPDVHLCPTVFWLDR